LLTNNISDAEALQIDSSSPQFQALHWLANDTWLANNDTAVLDLDSIRTQIVERYVLALLYFSTSADSGLNATSSEGGLNMLNFLSASSVCDWNNGERGALCNEDPPFVVALLLGKSKYSFSLQNFAMTHLFTFHSCWHECHACSHFLAILFEQSIMN
jgi:hypothetical protein